jgi:hypothetical protein
VFLPLTLKRFKRLKRLQHFSWEAWMPRIKLEEQASYEFMFPVTLYPRDINYAGPLGNDALVVSIGSARAEMFHSMGFAEGDLGDGKTGIIMSDLVSITGRGFIFDNW